VLFRFAVESEDEERDMMLLPVILLVQFREQGRGQRHVAVTAAILFLPSRAKTRTCKT
jgi:hypothetical protein